MSHRAKIKHRETERQMVSPNPQGSLSPKSEDGTLILNWVGLCRAQLTAHYAVRV